MLGTTASGLSAGTGACALLTGGTIRCWGDNSFGELGLGNKTQVSATLVPTGYAAVALPAARTALSISASPGFACARLSDGTAQCWGRNAAGQLGIGNTNTIGDDEVASTGLVVLGTTVTSIVTGFTATCAFFTSDGGLRCWGSNNNGELGYPDTLGRGGTGTTTPSQLPAVSFGTGRTAVAVFPGNTDTCALLDDNEVRCWGLNTSGQLGLGMVSTTPPNVGGTATTAPSNAGATTVQVLPP
jgi:alpha-tubulin suppressor-like RCC1 family protein